MTDPAKLVLCRAAFVVLCLCPTLAVAGWIMQRSLPGVVSADRDEWRRELSQRFGADVACSRVEYPSYDVAALVDVVFRDEETGAPLAHCPAIEITRLGSGLRIDLYQPVVEAAALPRLREILETRLLRSTLAQGAACEVHARDLTLRGESAMTTWRMVDGAWTPHETGPELELIFQPAAQASAAKPSRLLITRNRSQTPAVTRWQWMSGENPLPVRLFAAAWPELARLGENAWAQVDLEVASDGGALGGTLRGVLGNLDLNALVTEQFPHHLSGLATLKLSDAVVIDGRAIKLRGVLQARDGWVSPSLVASAQQHLALQGAAVEAASQANIPYRWLSLGFDLREDGLQLSGGEDVAGQEVLLVSAAGPILVAPSGHRAPAANLVALLAPAVSGELPSRAAQAVARFLPAPAGAPQTAHGHIPTRLGPARNAENRLSQPR
jgi:hypothetical protein